MAIQLSTSEQSVGYVEWDAGGVICYTRLYVRYAMESSTTARVYVRQVVATRDSGWTWSGTNNYYRTRADGYYDSGYTKYASGWGHSETQVWSGSFTCTTSNPKSLQCYFATYGGTYYGETWTEVFVPQSAFATPPTGLSVADVSATSNTVTGTVSITGWGTGATSGRYIELNISPSKSTDSDKRRWQPTTAGDTSLSAVLTCSSSSSGTMIIQPNKLYYVGAFATNGAANTGVQWSWGSIVTKPDKLSSATVLSFDRASATVRCVPSNNDGGQYARSLKYSLNGGATVDAGTISATKDITVSGLATGVTNTITLWITTTAGDSATIQVQIAAQQSIGFYVSRNNERKKTIEAYCSPSGTRKRVIKAYYSVGGVRKLFYES